MVVVHPNPEEVEDIDAAHEKICALCDDFLLHELLGVAGSDGRLLELSLEGPNSLTFHWGCYGS